MVTLAANVDKLNYAGRQLAIGEKFTPASEVDEKILVTAGRARYLRADEEADDNPRRQGKNQRGKLNRSDMQADE